jgi:nucleoside-diphosphate-sugar epimerase
MKKHLRQPYPTATEILLETGRNQPTKRRLRRIRKVAVTGGSGKAGRAVTRHLAESGYAVLNLDQKAPESDLGAHFMQTNLLDFAETLDMLTGYDAVVHLAAIPGAWQRPPQTTFKENMTSTFHVFQAAQVLGMQRVVWASSETVLGLPFDCYPPPYAPLDEKVPASTYTRYGLSKILAERMAMEFARWTGSPFIGLRFSNVMDAGDYQYCPWWHAHPEDRTWNLWGYVDVRDVSQACRLGLETDLEGALNFNITAADTIMEQTSEELMQAFFPKVPLKRKLEGNETIVSIGRAKKLLGYKPACSWRHYSKGES